MFDLSDRIRLAERERQISRGDAEHMFGRLDDVRDFLRHDRYLTDEEFDRRSRDLDSISRELRSERREGYGR